MIENGQKYNNHSNGDCESDDELIVPADKIDKLQNAYSMILKTINPDLPDHILRDTPLRAAKAMYYLSKGHSQQHKLDQQVDKALFENRQIDSDQLVTIRNIKVTSLCEHHLLPFSGECSIGYIPRKYILGVSKFARIVDCFSRRLNVQERLTQDIFTYLKEKLGTDSVIVVINSVHSCMKNRGIKDPNSSMITQCVGNLQPLQQQQFYMQIKL